MFHESLHSSPRPHRRDSRHGGEHLPFPFRDLFGHGHRGHHGIRRGEVRSHILAALGRKPMHGYEVIQDLEEQSGGRWRPSAGSVYPTLQQLADEGLVSSEEVDGRRVYTLTDAGRIAAEASPAHTRWDAGDDDGALDTRKQALQLVRAVMQVESVGSAGARSEANRILTDARRQIYRLLADDEAEPRR